jgi:hypothetical protein
MYCASCLLLLVVVGIASFDRTIRVWQQLPIKWHPSNFALLPSFVRAQIRCVLMLSLRERNEKRLPRHPETFFWILPKELLLQICEILWELQREGAEQNHPLQLA